MPSQSDQVFSHFIFNFLPQGLKGLILSGLCAAALSSLDSAINALGAVLIVDVLKRSPDQMPINLTRILYTGIAIGLVGVALMCIGTKDILVLGLKIGTFTYGGLLGVFLLLFTKMRPPFSMVLVAMVGQSLILLMVEHIKLLPWPWYTLIGCSLFFGLCGVQIMLHNLMSAAKSN